MELLRYSRPSPQSELRIHVVRSPLWWYLKFPSIVRADASKAKKLGIWYGFSSGSWMRENEKQMFVCVGGFVKDPSGNVVVKDGKPEIKEGN